MCIFSDRYLQAERFISAGHSAMMVPDPRFALPGSIPQYGPSRDFKTDHMKLEFSFDVAKKIVFGKATANIKMFCEADKISFDAVNMVIISAKERSGKAAKHTYDGNNIEITLKKHASIGETMEICIEYKIIDPSLGVYFISPDKSYPKKPVQIWTHSEAEEARYWYPCHDAPHEKMTMEMQIRVERGFFALSNGILEKTKEDPKSGNRTYFWKMSQPLPSYLVMFAVGKFSEIKDEWSGIPVLYYCEKGREADTKRAFGKTPRAMEFFSKITGVRYPYEKYAQVAAADFVFGGMEHTTATTQTDHALHDERAHEEAWSDGLMAHELAHQWFGDLITCRDWAHAWLNESFATYFEALFTEHDLGKDEFLYEIFDNARLYLAEDRDRYRRPIVTNIYAEPGDIFDRHLYQKGSVILHMLRSMLGETLWRKAIEHYTNKHRGKTVVTQDLINAIEEATGKNVDKFFDQWIFGAGHPELKANYFWDEKIKEAVVRIAQIQKADDQTPLFSLPLTIRFETKNGEKDFQETFEEKQKQFRYKLPSEPLDIRIDPENILLKVLTLQKPKGMWLYQLANDQNVIGKISAIQELAKIGNEECVRAMEYCYKREKFWGLHAEIAAALGTIKSKAAFNLLAEMAKAKNPKARRAVAAALGEYRDDAAFGVLKNMFLDKESYYSPAIAARSIGKTDAKDALQFLKKRISIESWNDVIKTGVLAGMAETKSEESVHILMDNAQYGSSSQARLSAIRLLGTAGQGKKGVLELLIKCAQEKSSMVQLAATFSLGELGDEQAIEQLKEMTKGHRDGRVKRQAQEAIRKIYPWLETDLESSEMRERYEKLKKEAEKKRI